MTIPRHTTDPGNGPERFLSHDACRLLADRVFAMAQGGGSTFLTVTSTWMGNLRWGRNRVTTSGDRQETMLAIQRTIRGAPGAPILTDAIDDPDVLQATMRRAEATVLWSPEDPDQQYPDTPAEIHPNANPKLWFDATYAIDPAARTRVANAVITRAESAGLLSAAYVETSASGISVINNAALMRYYPYTTAQFSLTMRDAAANASGWAGVDYNDWARIDTDALAQVAFDKCVRSRNPVSLEPGRYTAVLEPQAVCDLVAPILDNAMDRQPAEMGMGPFAFRPGRSKIGRRVFDPRFTLRADPMDPDGGFVPFDYAGEPYQAVNWIQDGILRELAYNRQYGLQYLNKDFALPNSAAFRLSGAVQAGATPPTVEEMIAHVDRGLLVTRFSGVEIVHMQSMLMIGTTRDGLWLIERGKITKAARNFRFTESPFFVFNNVEAIGTPQRVFRPSAPAVCPPVTARDFSFTGLADAV